MLAQPYKIVHFQRGNGFPSSYVYQVFQDSRNYIWMATDNGLVCYNGYAFKSFTTKDGLPDNAIFGICEDIRHRLWLKPFSKEISYLWRGKIYNRHNDPVLQKAMLRNIPQQIETDRWGNVFISESRAITCISPSGKVDRIAWIGKNDLYRVAILVDSSGVLMALNNDRLYRYQRDHFELVQVFPPSRVPEYIYDQVQSFNLEQLRWTPLNQFVSRYYANDKNGKYYTDVERAKSHYFRMLSDTNLALCTSDGLRIKDRYTGKLRQRFLEGYNVAFAMIDKDSNIWAGTLGQGVFRISRSAIRPVPLSKRSRSIRFLQAGPQDLVAGSEDGMLSLVQHTGAQPKLLWQRQIDPGHAHEICTYALRRDDGRWLIGLGGYMRLYTAGLGQKVSRQYLHLYNKDAVTEDKDHLLMGTPIHLLRVDIRQPRILDTFMIDRITSVAKMKQTVYAGTLNGLFASVKGTTMAQLALPGLAGHITALCADSVLWVANNDPALIAIHNDRILARLDRNDGLVCNHITAIKASDSLLWVGTDEGLYAVTRHAPFKVVQHLSEMQGLNNNEVRHLATTHGIVWVGTNKGLDYFREQEMIPVKRQVSFLVTALRNEDTVLPLLQQTMELKGKTLRIDFDVIDQSGISRPKVAYRLNEGNWVELDNDYLYFPTLPYGDFSVYLRASAPGWNAPKVIRMSFYRPYPLYLRWWFLLAIALIGAALLVYLVRRYLVWESKKERERLLVQQNLLQLEQLALQGQMNAHFIFNCLTAIRHYYNKGDLSRANRFVDVFSTLIRTAFEMVNQTFTSLDKELRYLGQYLKVEQERFNHSFRFNIATDIVAPTPQIPVPTMLLQPLVENAVKHGVRSLPDGVGMINIGITQQGEWINIVVEDNGVGRKRNKHIDEAGRPVISITSTTVNKKRIDILNKLFDGQVSMLTADITDEEGRIAGTRVTLTYPLSIYEHTT